MNRLLFGDNLKWLRDPMGGVLITLESPTKPMVRESVEVGRYTAKLHRKEFPKIQILTVGDLVTSKKRVEAPPQANLFVKAEAEGAAAKMGKTEKQEEIP